MWSQNSCKTKTKHRTKKHQVLWLFKYEKISPKTSIFLVQKKSRFQLKSFSFTIMVLKTFFDILINLDTIWNEKKILKGRISCFNNHTKPLRLYYYFSEEQQSNLSKFHASFFRTFRSRWSKKTTKLTCPSKASPLFYSLPPKHASIL